MRNKEPPYIPEKEPVSISKTEGKRKMHDEFAQFNSEEGEGKEEHKEETGNLAEMSGEAWDKYF